eukprot:8276044-Pyramimonas_sp.AAC.1
MGQGEFWHAARLTKCAESKIAGLVLSANLGHVHKRRSSSSSPRPDRGHAAGTRGLHACTRADVHT